jgi:hypothetical protein
LRGGPRIIDATSYWLEARTLAHGAFTFSVPEPTAAFRGRFLLASHDGGELGVIFPPGYPLLLSLGMRLGAPLVVGPVLGALLVLATYGLARAAGQERRVAWVAASLSVLCGALRYHTADTMSHGLATLLGCTALYCALRRELRYGPLLGGLCLGWLVATRPVSALVTLLLVAVALGKSARGFVLLALGMVPGVALLLLYQRALTGSYFSSTQLAYYAVADAPAGCFRYGFGAGIGCRFEHGDYVAHFLPEGYGIVPALRNLGVHLWNFAQDATNLGPVALLALYAGVRQRRSPLGLLAVGVAVQALAYTPFYFDGNYPGGGARFLCEAIPFAHVLVARATCELRVPWLAPLAAALGFATLGHTAHAALRDREGGRPMFEPSVVERTGVRRGLVFVTTDHGFNLGHDPGLADAQQGVLVARLRDDAHDRELYERLGAPPSYRYVYDFKGHHASRLEPFVPPPSLRYEAEAEWPPLAIRGSAYPVYYPCASRGRALRLQPGSRLRFRVEDARAQVAVGWVSTTPIHSLVRLQWAGQKPQIREADGPGCSAWEIVGPEADVTPILEAELVSGEGALDYFHMSAPAPIP